MDIGIIKNYIMKIIRSYHIIKDAFKKSRYWGYKLICKTTYYDLLGLWLNTKFYDKKYHIIKKFLKNRYKEILSIDFTPTPKTNIKRIWIFWWQGREHMPDICKACYKYLHKNNESTEIIYISKDNYNQFINIPNEIQQKVDNGIFSITHLSDIIRVMLLAQYGGLWIDATVLVVHPIPDEWFKKPFFSIKNKEIPTPYISKYRWSTFIMGSCGETSFFNKLSALISSYAKKENDFIEYMTIDIFMDILFEDVKYNQLLNDLQICNEGLHSLRPLLNKSFNRNTFEQLINDNICFKLTYKMNFKDTNKNVPTFYHYLTHEIQ